MHVSVLAPPHHPPHVLQGNGANAEGAEGAGRVRFREESSRDDESAGKMSPVRAAAGKMSPMPSVRTAANPILKVGGRRDSLDVLPPLGLGIEQSRGGGGQYV